MPNSIRLIIAGTDHGSGFLQQLEERVIAYGLEGVVSFVGHIDSVHELLQAADIFCLPSFEEPFGMVFLEAMEHGLPIVALNSGAVPEIVRHCVDGLLSEPGDIEQLTANLLALCEDRQMRRAMGEAGRKRTSSSFTRNKMVSEIKAQYQLLQ